MASTLERLLRLRVLGDASGARRALGELESTTGGIGRSLARMGAVVGGAAAGAVVAASSFEDRMREVFTLLPGISSDAMDEMADQVKTFSVEFGVLPNDVVPALYQAISAGVPRENVFDFLETAQKAAKGGVTDLATAVDGITSVVNAYGSDVLSAAEASDLMFTAVRLGKTTFGELSSALFNVTPVAASFGVQFGDVTAALAALTAQGVPTAVATTQLRSALAELGKEGKKGFAAFVDATGKTFPEFVAEGGTLVEAFDIMRKHADDMGVSVLDLFGRIEGGQAVLSLSGSDAFADAAAEMQESAGATEQAFETMNSSLSATWGRLKARVLVGLIDLGERLLPPLERLGDFIEGSLIPFGGRLADAWGEDGVAGVWRVLSDRFSWVGDWISKHRPVFAGFAAVVATAMVAAFTSWAVAAGAAAAATIAAAAPFIAIGAAVAALAAGLVWAYDNIGVFRSAVDGVARFIRDNWRPAFEAMRDAVVGAVRVAGDVIAPFVGAVMSVVGGVRALFSGDWAEAWQSFKRAASAAIDGVLTFWRELPGRLLSAAAGLGSRLWSWGWHEVGALKTAVETWFAVELKPWMAALPGRVLRALGDLSSVLWSAGWELMAGMWRGMRAGFDGLVRNAERMVTSLPRLVAGWLGISSPSRVMIPVGEFTMAGFAEGLRRGFDDVERLAAGATAELPARFVSQVAPTPPVAAAPVSAVAAGGEQPIVVEVHLGDGVVARAVERASVRRPLRIALT